MRRFWSWFVPTTPSAGCVVTLFVLSGIAALAGWLAMTPWSPT